MAITVAQTKAQIILEVGDVDPATGDPPAVPSNGLIATNIDFLWERWAAKDQVAPGLRELYTKRSALRMVMAVLGPKRFDAADALAGLSAKASQVWEHCNAQHECVKGEIQAILDQSQPGRRTYLAGSLSTATPTTIWHRPDPNNPRYGGMPGHHRWPRTRP